MAFGWTNISLFKVACTVGVINSNKLVTNLASICQSANVNKYSRFRPGYWYMNAQGNLAFKRPDGTSADPRNNNDGRPKLGYYLGDFRGYNPSANAPGFTGGMSEIEFLYASNVASSQTCDIVFELGEVDWFNEETEFHGRNNLAYDYVWIYSSLNGGTLTKAATVHKSNLITSGYNKRVDTQASVTVPASGTYVYTFYFYLGTSAQRYAKFPNSLTVKITRVAGAYVYLGVLSTTASNLTGKLLGLEDGDENYDVSEVRVANGEMEIKTALGYAAYENVRFEVVLTNQRRYWITTSRLRITGKGYCYTKPRGDTGSTLQSSNTFDKQIADSGLGIYNFRITLPEIANDAEWFYLDITAFGNTWLNVTPATE